MSTPLPALPDAAREDGVSRAIRRVAVGSANPGKVAAVQAAIARLWPGATVEGAAVPSGVADQPRLDREGARGALHRAAAARAVLDADLGIGLEGSADDQPSGMYTLAWVAAVDRAARVGLASTGRCPLPETIAVAIRAGGELGPLVDGLVGERNTKHRGGASATFTAGHTSRVESLAGGVVYACAPFLTPEFFGPSAMGRLPDVLARLDAVEIKRNVYTLTFVRRPDGRLLFLHRLRPPNQGQLTGIEGSIDPEEDLLAAAAREVSGAAGIAVEPRLRLLITSWEPGRTARGEPPVLMYICAAGVDASTAAAVPTACLEGPLLWLRPEDLADHPLVPNIRIMLPWLFAAAAGAVVGTFWYEAGRPGGRYLLHAHAGPLRGRIPAE